MNLREILNRELLPTVQRPSRYVGTEFNSVHKPPEEVELRVALAFPDLYDLGLGNLGLHILYTILNDLPWCWAERTYAPAPDMEAALRERGLPLYAYESKDALSDLDLVGFTLQSELTYTSVLNMIDLSGLPLRASGRADAHPIICAGGPGALNPEPLAPFIDCFIIGDGEEAIVEVATVLRSLRGGQGEKSASMLWPRCPASTFRHSTRLRHCRTGASFRVPTRRRSSAGSYAIWIAPPFPRGLGGAVYATGS